jgi:putative ABC transport system permease protein
VASIGGGVLIAILLASMNTMLMAGIEQTHDVGILKALGFRNGPVFGLMVLQGLFLCLLGGGAGVALALLTEPWVGQQLGSSFPGYGITTGTIVLGLGVSLLVGLAAGVLPARNALRLKAVDALRTEE